MVVLTEDADADPPCHPSKSPTEAEKVKKEIKQERKEKYDQRIANECSSAGKETGSVFCQAPPVHASIVSFRSVRPNAVLTLKTRSGPSFEPFGVKSMRTIYGSFLYTILI